MKKFLLYLTLTLLILISIFGYILYKEGAFESKMEYKTEALEPFMKCEAGKCASGKCAGK